MARILIKVIIYDNKKNKENIKPPPYDFESTV